MVMRLLHNHFIGRFSLWRSSLHFLSFYALIFAVSWGTVTMLPQVRILQSVLMVLLPAGLLFFAVGCVLSGYKCFRESSNALLYRVIGFCFAILFLIVSVVITLNLIFGVIPHTLNVT